MGDSLGKDAQTGVRRQQRHGAGGEGGRGDESRGQKQCSKGGYGSCRVRGLPRPVCPRCLVFPASSLPVSSLPSPLYCPPFGLSRVHCLTFWLLLAPLRPWRRLGREVQRTGGRTVAPILPWTPPLVVPSCGAGFYRKAARPQLQGFNSVVCLNCNVLLMLFAGASAGCFAYALCRRFEWATSSTTRRRSLNQGTLPRLVAFV